ncbi:MAG: tRNA (adenosine(37)-N6)-threonylcarbamoyltransferase complex dimerization subunit type 1 TsaB [Candidatus Acidiferrum sp.]
MITLALDTSEARGSVALLLNCSRISIRDHADGSDYSGWLLPAVNEVLREAGTKLEQLDLLAVSTGPGSFTGLRVGLTTVKAWSQVYGTPIVGVSRLEAIARSHEAKSQFVAACYDAQRGQLFGALYLKRGDRLERVGDEMVSDPQEFVSFIHTTTGKQPVTWISLDPGLIRSTEAMSARIPLGDTTLTAPTALAPAVGTLAEEYASEGKLTDSLSLDANYVRRSDAEIFWKG